MTYSACKHCASGCFVILLLFVSLLIFKDLHTCTRSMPRINRVGGYACICLKLREVHRSCINTHIHGSSRNDIILVFLKVNWISHSFSSCFYGRAGGEDGFVYSALLFSFCLDYMHVPYNNNEDKLTTLYLQAS